MKPRVSLLLLLPYTEQEPQPPPTPPHLRETGKSLKFSPSFPCSRTGIEPRIIPPSAESQICSALLLPAAALLCEGANCSSFCAASPLQIVAGLPPNCSSGFACRILLVFCQFWKVQLLFTVHRYCSRIDGQQLTGIKCLVWRCLVMWRLIEIAL
ncbi:hypothetical protein SLEP1_g53439 [Rubroshorea leprosula]|uniref:Uncharacterized protein n=1 Tax=Rubroshorea leprosula TaxID=152421 RepID=A0AAV5MAI7_9ROSI|nr:hypothetical protein SLEP1_g53439 [Rubroshorea leprosula]